MTQSGVNWSTFGGFQNVNKKDLETAFSDNVGGESFSLGVHKDVTIDSVEPGVSKAGNAYIKLTIKDDAGCSINKFVMLQDSKGEFSYSYRELSRAAVSDLPLRLQVFSGMFVDNPALLDSLRGVKLTIKIEQGQEGYIVKKDAISGEYKIIDVETNEEYEEIAGQTFPDYDAVKEKAEEVGLKRCYNEVKKLIRGSKNAVEANETALRALVLSSQTGGTGVTAIASGARRPTI